MKTTRPARMVHEQEGAKKKPRKRDVAFLLEITFIVLTVLVLLLVVVTREASAATTSSAQTCASVGINNGVAVATVTLIWQLDNALIGCDAGNNCNSAAVTDANFCGFDLPAGAPVTYECIETNPVGSSALTTITLSAYSDNSNLGGGGSPIWTDTSHNSATSPCSSSVNTTLLTQSLTSTGAAGASARTGIVRVFVSIAGGTGPTAFSCNSDGTGETVPAGSSCVTHFVGVGRSDPGFTSPNATGSAPCATGCQIYQGGDTLTATITPNASSYAAANRGATFIKTGSGGFVQAGTNWGLGTTAISESILAEDKNTWLAGAMTDEWTETGGSAITLGNGFTGLSYWTFQSAFAPALTVVNLNTATWDTTDTFSRTMTASGCTLTDGNLTGHPAETVINRLENVRHQCNWVDARGASIPNNAVERGWEQKTGDYRVSTDFPSVDALGMAGGAFLSNPTATNVATVTTVASLSYHGMVELFDTTRGDSTIKLWGNTSGAFDVQSDLTVSCALLDPVDHVTSGITTYNPDESVQCRSVRLQWHNGVDVPSGFIRIFYRQSTASSGDTTDSPSCDTTTNGTGVQGWIVTLCDGKTRPAFTGDVRARATTGLKYVVEVAQFDVGARNDAVANDGTTSGKFDVSLSYSAVCTWNDVSLGAAATVANRGDTVGCRSADVMNVRGQLDPSAIVRVFERRGTQPDRDTTDVPSCDTTASTAGAWTCDAAVKTTATTTTGLAYGVEVVKWFEGGRTTMVVETNVSSLFDVSSTYHFANLYLATAAPANAGSNRSTFIIGSDPVIASAAGLSGAAGQLIVNANVTCQETFPDGITHGPVTGIGATDSTGTTPSTQMENPTQGPPGAWTIVCSVTMNGNAGTFSLRYFHVSAFTGDTNVVIDWHANDNGKIDISCGIHTIDEITQTVDAQTVDNESDFRFSVFYIPFGGNGYLQGPAGFCVKQAPEFYEATFTIPSPCPEYVHVHAWANFTGKPLLGTSTLQVCAVNETGNFTGNFSILGASGMISTILDPYFAFIFWGGLLFWFLVSKRWFVALGAFLCLIDALLDQNGTPEMGLFGRFFFFLFMLMLELVRKLFFGRDRILFNDQKPEKEKGP